MASVHTSQIFHVIYVPSQHVPAGAIRPRHAEGILWAIQGTGTNFGIVTSFTFQAFPSKTWYTRNRMIELGEESEIENGPKAIELYAIQHLSIGGSADVCLYSENGQLRVGLTTYELSDTLRSDPDFKMSQALIEKPVEIASRNDTGIFQRDMYVSTMHGGHGGGKTYSFKRCIFLKHIGDAATTAHLMAALRKRPTDFCYLHLLHGGGMIGEVEHIAIAFGCRGWDQTFTTSRSPRGDSIHSISLPALVLCQNLKAIVQSSLFSLQEKVAQERTIAPMPGTTYFLANLAESFHLILSASAKQPNRNMQKLLALTLSA